MDEQKLAQIQGEIMQEMDNEAKIEKNIEEAAEAIAGNLMMNPQIIAEVNKTPYRFAYKLLPTKTGKVIYLIIADTIKYKIIGNKYTPFTATAVVDDRYSMRDNLKTTVETWIRHLTGRIKVEALEDNGAYQVGKNQ
jgi:hypothetical protein